MQLTSNTTVQDKSLLNSLEQAARVIGLHVYANEIEIMYFKQERSILYLRSRPLKSEEKFTFLGSNISSLERDVNIQLAKTWNDIDLYGSLN